MIVVTSFDEAQSVNVYKRRHERRKTKTPIVIDNQNIGFKSSRAPDTKQNGRVPLRSL